MNALLHKLLAPLLTVLRQGLSPRELALAFSLGITLSCFPVFGATTTLCLLASLLFRLNLPAIQAANYAATPLQLLLLLPFLRMGEWLFHTDHLTLSITQLRTLFARGTLQALHNLWMWEWHAIVVWAIVVIPASTALNLLLRPILNIAMKKAAPNQERPIQ
jgi:hypothetical protein